MKIVRHKFLLRLGLVLGLLLVAAGGYYLLRYHAWTAYRNWSITRMNDMARDFIAAGDSRNALLTVRKVLRKRPNDIAAWHLGVEASRQRDTAEVVQFQRNLCRVEPTVENQLELIRLALRYRVNQVALQAVSAVSAEAGNLPEYHRLAAQVYRLAGRDVTARYHLVSLLAMVPDDKAAQLALAEIEFAADGTAVPADWTARVARLAQEPDLAVPAALLQMQFAVARKDVVAATPLVRRFENRIDLPIAQRLQVLAALELCDPPAAERFLANVQLQAATQPADAVQVMAWLVQQSRLPALVAWYAQLPEATRRDETIKLHTARALATQRDWAALEQVVRGPRWTKDEALRMALLARACQMTGRTADFAESWKLAVIAIGQDVRTGARLLQTVTDWGWTEERRDVLWKLFALLPTNRPVREELITHEFLQGNTVNLNRIYARIVEAAPNDDEARNNFAYTSLLLDTNLNRAQAMARDLHRRYPENTAYLTTYTLALHKQGESEQALGLLEALPPAAQMTSSVMLHEAAYAGAAGRIQRASELLPQLVRVRALPEESALLATARVAVAKDSVRAGRQQALAAAGTSTAGGWLELLPDTAKDAGNELKLADAFYRDRNFPALTELVQGATWKQNDHLRHALDAYARRQGAGDNGAVDAWRQAVGSAGRDSRRLRDLEILAGHWHWQNERMEVTARRFEREASNPALLAELLDFYRQQARVADLARTLWLYVNETKTTGEEAAWCVYYSLLCDMNVNSAQTLAHRVYTAAPQAPASKIAYAFALWRQQRAAEAWSLLQNVDAEKSVGMQVFLVQAAVLLELDRKQEARNSLARFVAVGAMPEERNFADTLYRKIGLEGATITLTTNETAKSSRE